MTALSVVQKYVKTLSIGLVFQKAVLEYKWGRLMLETD